MTNDLPPMAERRPARRARMLRAGVLAYGDGAHSFRCSIRDLSDSGAQISIPADFVVPRPVYLIDVRARTAYQAERIWSDGKAAGLKFLHAVAIDRLDDPALAYLKRLTDAMSTRAGHG